MVERLIPVRTWMRLVVMPAARACKISRSRASTVRFHSRNASSAASTLADMHQIVHVPFGTLPPLSVVFDTCIV